MIRLAGPDDAAAMELFLQDHASSSMFLRGNLEAHGTNDREHRHGTAFFLHEEHGQITAIAGRTTNGYVMSQAPSLDLRFFDSLAQELRGQTIAGMTGEPEQVNAFLEKVGCKKEDFAKRDVQPLYEMDVSHVDFSRFARKGRLRGPKPDDAGFLERWFAGYHADTGVPLPPGSNLGMLATNFVQNNDTRLLIVDDVPVAMTALNARACDTVQVGGVFVPRNERGNGYGGQSVAMHLSELQRQGITKAILFAASAVAAHAYEKIGFIHIGAYEIALLKEPYVIGATQ